MSTTLVTPDLDALVCEIDITAPRERVFQALTDSGKLARWFTSPECPAKYWKMDARKGGRYGYATEKSKITVNGVDQFECHGEILEYDPPRLIAYTWIGNWHADKQKETVVRWELTAVGKGTHVKVTHSGLAAEPTARDDYREGWPGVVGMLKQFVETH
jgi:uncharacterized protein YndB with AHSA1/START domain